MNKESLIEALRKQEFKSNILEAFKLVDREKFVPEHLKKFAYDDMALPTDEDSSLSQPSTIAFMLTLLDVGDNDKILEIGSGGGYVLSLLSNLTKNAVYGIELKPDLAAKSAKMLFEIPNINVINSDGSKGLEKIAPFDKIIMSAAAQDNATVYNLVSQLREGGIIVAPVKDTILKIKKIGNMMEKQEFAGYSFVELKTNLN